MANPNIRIKRSSVEGKRPSLSQVDLGELALNTNDGRLFTRKENVGIGSTVTLLNPWTENIGGGTYYNDGNVGINTTNPTAKLTVMGNVSISSTVGIGTIIDIIPYDTLNSGTLSFEGSAGQLFSITNNLTTGSIFSVNDVSGIPSIDVDADGTIQLAPFGSTEYVGVGKTNPTEKLDVNGNIKAAGNIDATTVDTDNLNIGTQSVSTTTSTSVSTTSPTTIDSFAAATYRSARVQVQITQGTDYQTSDVLVIHDGSTASVVEYGSIATNDYLGTFSATVSGGNCLLQINMGSATSATVKVLSQRITV